MGSVENMNVQWIAGWWLVMVCGTCCGAQSQPLEIHHRLRLDASATPSIALTLDACSGKLDQKLIEFLVEERIPSTLFVTQKWLRKNAKGVALIKAHPDLFDVQNHGARHVPAVIGANKRVYGIAAHTDLNHLQREVMGGALAVTEAFGNTPRWYRAATARYDVQAVQAIEAMGFQIAGFSVNADSGATAGKKEIARRLRRVQSGDIIIAHMNKPTSETAEGLALGLTRLKQRGFQFVRMQGAQVIAVGSNVP